MAEARYEFGWEGALERSWEALVVQRIEGSEALSGPTRYQLWLRAPERGPLPQELVGARASLRLVTFEDPAWRWVHGVITEAETAQRIQGGVVLRVTLEPPLCRARCRHRSRIFLNKSLRQIVEAVLTSDPHLRRELPEPVGSGDDYRVAEETLAWRLADPTRIDSPEARPYCVQYDETDHDFLARLLEDEGLTYHHEHEPGRTTLVLSDNHGGRPRIEGEPFGHARPKRDLRDFHPGARLRPDKVVLYDYDYAHPTLPLAASAGDASRGMIHRYPGGFRSDASGGGRATTALEREASAAQFATAEARCRQLRVGARFTLAHDDARLDGEYLVCALELSDSQGEFAADGDETFRSRIECVRADRPYRPPCGTPRPRIAGSQTAVVTGAADGGVHVGENLGSVRLRFHWDRDPDRHADEPTSCWVRVSHGFAGAGEGAMWHPRIGNEVVVEFLEGDPDRPLVTGRIYNGKNLPPGPADGSPTVSTFKTLSLPGAGQHNELRFDDAAGAEKIHLHAGRDWETVVQRNRDERVHGDASETTDGKRATQVAKTNDERVDGNEKVAVGGGRTLEIVGDASRQVGGQETISITGDQGLAIGKAATINVGAERSLAVGADDTQQVGGSRAVSIGGDEQQAVAGNRTTSAGGNETATVAGQRTVQVQGNAIEAVDGAKEVTAGGAMTMAASGAMQLATDDAAVVQAASAIAMQAPEQAFVADETISLKVGDSSLTIHADKVVIATGGGTVTIQDGRIKHNC